MSFATVFSRAIIGIDAPQVKIEVHISNGLPAFQIVGLPDTSVRESRDRVRSAIINSQLQFPQVRLTVNLSPADIPKEGARYDLAIAVGILVASKQIKTQTTGDFEFLGELGLNGELRSIRAAIPSVIAINKANRTAILPDTNAQQISLLKHSSAMPASTLLEVFNHFCHKQLLDSIQPHNHSFIPSQSDSAECLSDVVGQEQGRRVLEIAAAGQHNLLFLGAPGTGKSMLATRLISILPEMTEQEAIETASINSIAGKAFDHNVWKTRPFRSPHHTVSGVALVGGGSIPKPGEVSLAQNGILFLDELPEFSRKVLDVLREPMETGKVTISRAAQQAEFPAQFQLVAALNPSPTGHYNDGRTSRDQILKYLNKISGPILDRIELQIELNNIKPSQLVEHQVGESSEQVRKRVIKARSFMLARANKPNALLDSKEVLLHCRLTQQQQAFIQQAIEKLALSARAYHKVLKVARTIADLEQSEQIEQQHLAEALGYRAMDRLLNYLSKN